MRSIWRDVSGTMSSTHQEVSHPSSSPAFSRLTYRPATFGHSAETLLIAIFTGRDRAGQGRRGRKEQSRLARGISGWSGRQVVPAGILGFAGGSWVMRWVSRVVGARLREDVIDKVSGVCERHYIGWTRVMVVLDLSSDPAGFPRVRH